MAAVSGLLVRVKIATTSVAGAKMDGMQINRETIDVTNKDDAAVQKLLAALAKIAHEFTVEGILVGDTLITWANNPAEGLKEMSFEVPTIGTFTGSFALTSFGIQGSDTEGATFSATFNSAGTVAFAAAGS